MGAMECSRKGCGLLSRLRIDEIGCICYDCKQEFKDYLEQNQIEADTNGKILKELKAFMATAKNNDYKITVDDFFKSYET